MASLSGSKHAKQRMVWFLKTLSGEDIIADAPVVPCKPEACPSWTQRVVS